MKYLKPITYFHVITGNRGDMAIKKSITEAIQERINVPFAFFNVKFEELTEQRIINQLNKDCSALIIAGSGLYTNYPMSSGFYFPCKTELFEKIKVPIMLIGLGCNNNLGSDIFKGDLTDKAKKSIKLINDLAVISTVRDQRTYDMLSNLGITKHQLMLDPGNFLRVPRIPEEKRVAINLAQHSPALGRFDGTTELRTYNVNTFANISNYLINKNYEVIFIAHDALETSLFIDIKKFVPRLQYLNSDNLDEMLKEYSRCQFSIGAKMHSSIMSFASGTPFISLYYDQKQIEYLKMIDCNELGISIFSDYSDTLKEKIDMIINNLDYYTNKIVNLKQQEQIKFDTLMDKLCNIISTTP